MTDAERPDALPVQILDEDGKVVLKAKPGAKSVTRAALDDLRRRSETDMALRRGRCAWVFHYPDGSSFRAWRQIADLTFIDRGVITL